MWISFRRKMFFKGWKGFRNVWAKAIFTVLEQNLLLTSVEWSKQANKISTASPWTLNGSIYNSINDAQLASLEILWKTSQFPLPFERVGDTFPLLIPNLWAWGRFYDRKGVTINFSSQEQSANPRALNTTLVFANVPTGASGEQSSLFVDAVWSGKLLSDIVQYSNRPFALPCCSSKIRVLRSRAQLLKYTLTMLSESSQGSSCPFCCLRAHCIHPPFSGSLRLFCTCSTARSISLLSQTLSWTVLIRSLFMASSSLEPPSPLS